MSETLKFGGGKWGVKKGSTLAFNDENGNFKPLPFTFDRSTSATRVNKEGLIEVVSNNEPRIDFLNDSKGALLLEPLRNNFIPYSTLDFNGGSKPEGWSIGFGTGTYSYEQLTYKGQKAVKQTQITTGRSYLDTGTISILANTEHTFKIQFILDECVADADDIICSINGFGVFQLIRFNQIDANGILNINFTSTTTTTGSIRLGLGASSNEDGGKSLAWAIPQLEAGSYPTSYIPTQGSIGTRDAESCIQTNINTSIISSSYPFSMYVESTYIVGNEQPLSFINSNVANNYYVITINSNVVNLDARANGLTELISSGVSLVNGQKFKAAITMQSATSGKICVNGNTVISKTNFSNQSVNSNINDLLLGQLRTSLDTGNRLPITDARLYNTALTDQELINLTTI